MGALTCWNCGHSLDDVPRPISRHATCSACFNELHCCRLCKHYRTKINSSCDEDRADPPTIKENANFCDWFAPRAGAYQKKADKSDDAKDKLEALFGGDASTGEDGSGSESNESSDQPASDSASYPSNHPSSHPLSTEDRARADLEALFQKKD